MKPGSLFHVCEFKTYEKSVPRALDAVKARPLFSSQATILLKPNIVNASAFPVTTSPAFCRAVIQYIRSCSDARLIIGEGCGDSSYETGELFDRLGYRTLADEFDVELMDLNQAELVKLSQPSNRIFPEMYLPRIAMESFLVSLPVLKAHSLAQVTGTLKNMMGLAPPKYYSGSGIWKKALFHNRMHDSIAELNRHRTPDFSIMDASVGLSAYHLGGPCCQPPVSKLIVSDDPWKMDQHAAGLLGLDPEAIFHIHPR